MNEIDWCTENEVRVLLPADLPGSFLAQQKHRPAKIYFQGNLEILKVPLIAIVGGREASPAGLKAAFTFGRDLARAGFCIVSGLARGVDTAAHQGALHANGKTLAVLGHGLSQIYPRAHLKISRQILQSQGGLMSEYLPFVPPRKHQFPERNRIIAGISVATVVIEAREKSGSLITAQWALEDGRELFVLPGPHDSVGFRGSHELIRSGATLITKVSDILEALAFETELPVTQSFESYLAPCMKEGPVSLSVLVERSGRSTSDVLEELERLQQTGDVVETAPQLYWNIK